MQSDPRCIGYLIQVSRYYVSSTGVLYGMYIPYILYWMQVSRYWVYYYRAMVYIGIPYTCICMYYVRMYVCVCIRVCMYVLAIGIVHRQQYVYAYAYNLLMVWYSRCMLYLGIPYSSVVYNGMLCTYVPNTYVRMQVCTYVRMYVCACMHIRMYVCVYTYTRTHVRVCAKCGAAVQGCSTPIGYAMSTNVSTTIPRYTGYISQVYRIPYWWYSYTLLRCTVYGLLDVCTAIHGTPIPCIYHTYTQQYTYGCGCIRSIDTHVSYVIYQVRPLGGRGVVHCMMIRPISRWYSYAMDTPYMAYMCVCMESIWSPYVLFGAIEWSSGPSLGLRLIANMVYRHHILDKWQESLLHAREGYIRGVSIYLYRSMS